MIIRLSLSAICLFFLLAVLILAAQVSAAQVQHREPSDLQQICPIISVSCSPDVKDDEPTTFGASVKGGDRKVIPTYYWTVVGARITHGQGSPAIEVERLGSGSTAFTGTVMITGFDLACPKTASCSFIIEHNVPNSVKFDSYGVLPRRMEISRLNPLAVQLKSRPGAQAYLLVYRGRRGRFGEAQKVAHRSLEYLVKKHGIDARRIVTVEAGVKEKLTIDLWIVPTGATPPSADPTVNPSKIIKP